MPVRHQIRRVKGYRFPAGAKAVHRGTGFGNPFRVGVHGTAAECVRRHFRLVMVGMICACPAETPAKGREHMEEQRRHLEYVKANIHKLRGKDLACFCPIDSPCHADTLMRLANGPTCEECTP
jgi:hypothetical protein